MHAKQTANRCCRRPALAWLITAIALLFPYSSLVQADLPKEWVIGTPYALTGWAGAYGASEANSARLAGEEINAQGGILGRPVRIVLEDTRSEPTAVASAVKKLLEVDDADIIVGPNFAEFSEVAAPIAEAKKTVLLTPSGYTDSLTKNRHFVFSMQPGHQHSARPLSQYLATQNHQHLAVITAQTTFFELFSGAFVEQLQGLRKTTVQVVPVKPDERDFRSMLLRFKRAGVDAIVYFGGVSGEAADFYRQLKAINYTPAVYGTEYIALDPVIKANPALAEGTVYLGYFVVATPEYLKKYEQRFGAMPTFSSPRAYDALYVLKAALERCQGSLANLVGCLEATDYQGVTGRVRFQSDHTIAGDHVVSELWQVKNGAFRKLVDAGPQSVSKAPRIDP